MVGTADALEVPPGMSWRRVRNYDPSVGRFTTMDAFEASPSDPMHLHKYVYAGNDPVNHVDPSGHDFSLVGMMVTGGIIGALTGMTAGAVYGTYKSGKFLSWDTAKYALIGMVGGGIAGALVGGAVYAAGPMIASGTRSLVTKLLHPGGHSKTEMAALGGFVLGFAGGLLNPNLNVSMYTAYGTAADIAADIVVRGMINKRNEIAAVVGPFYRSLVTPILFKYVQSGTFMMIGFGVGFAAGYAVGSVTRVAYDNLMADAGPNSPNAIPADAFAGINYGAIQLA